MRDFLRTAQTLAAAGIAAVLTLGYIVYSGRELGPQQFADLSAALALIYFFSLVASPLTPTVARVVARLAVRGDVVGVAVIRRAVLTRIFRWGSIAFVAALAVSPFLARALHFRAAATVVLAFCCVFSFLLLSTDRGVLQGLLRFREYNANTVLEAAIRFGGAVGLILLVARSAVPAMISYVAALVIAEVLIASRFGREWRHLPSTSIDWTEFDRLARPMMWFMAAIAVFQNADMLAVKRWFPAIDSGAYGAASSLARVVGVIFVPLNALAGPVLTAAHETKQRITGTGLRLTATLLVLTSVPLALFAIWPRTIVTALYGPAFAEAATVVAPLTGVAVITYTAIMLAQVPITLGDFAFLRACAVVAALEIAGLVLFHRSFADVLTVLYVSQGAMLLAMVVMVLRRINR